MRPTLFFTLTLLSVLSGCAEHPTNNTASSPTSDHTPATTDNNVPANTAADNTAVNVRDRDSQAKTPLSQNENQADINVTANIRKRVVGSKMSINAQNVKIITQDGKVTLRGPVNSEEEKAKIQDIAIEIAGTGKVDSQLEVKP